MFLMTKHIGLNYLIYFYGLIKLYTQTFNRKNTLI